MARYTEAPPVALLHFLFDIVEALICLRLLFKLLGANPENFFTNLLYSWTGPLIRPFQGIFSDTSFLWGVIEWSAIVAGIIYGLAFALFLRVIAMLFSTVENGDHLDRDSDV